MQEEEKEIDLREKKTFDCPLIEETEEEYIFSVPLEATLLTDFNIIMEFEE